jgi:flap endonuclease-1
LQLKWENPDVEGLVEFLCGDKGFKEERVRSGAAKLAKSKSTATQGRLSDFFKVIPNNNPPVKRKVEEKPKSAKKGKGSFKRGK